MLSNEVDKKLITNNKKIPCSTWSTCKTRFSSHKIEITS